MSMTDCHKRSVAGRDQSCCCCCCRQTDEPQVAILHPDIIRKDFHGKSTTISPPPGLGLGLGCDSDQTLFSTGRAARERRSSSRRKRPGRQQRSETINETLIVDYSVPKMSDINSDYCLTPSNNTEWIVNNNNNNNNSNSNSNNINNNNNRNINNNTSVFCKKCIDNSRFSACNSSVKCDSVSSVKCFRKNASFWTGRTVQWLFLFTVMFTCFVSPLSAQKLGAQNLPTNKNTEICQSVDIRNSLETFEKLRGCRVVEGFVQILLFDKTEELAYSNISFPELTEITDYLLLYRVNGLKTLETLFPNLAVIRGQKTFFNYAFVLFEMSSLEEIGLYSLTDIVHGLVRIDKNPSLCYVNTIDWDLIAKEGKGDEHFIKSNKIENACPVCPGDDGNNEVNCPAAKHRAELLSSGLRPGRHLCWNKRHCQKVCPDRCIEVGKTCNVDNECCHESCLGGCTGMNRDICTVCKKLSVGDGNQRQCTSKCPADSYEFLNRRCVSRNVCINLKRPIDNEHEYKDKPYKAFNGSCLLQCPPNYVEDYSSDKSPTCKPCEGSCKKECPSANVDSISSAQSLRGCTHIKGSLEIQIRGGRFVVKELEENLNMIEVIDGYLKIARSFPLVSLNFLKRLREISGKQLESGKYVFIVLDNQNLQELWDWDSSKKQIKISNKGKLFFHFNPKLCLNKIEKLRTIAGLEQFTDLEVAPTSNGDKVPCNVTELIVNTTKIFSNAVILQWEQFKMDDQRSLLGYVVHSIEAPYKNVSLYDGRDGCGGDGWRVDDLNNPESPNDLVYHVLTELKPYTQYAFFVRTYTIATEISGAQSPIYYFLTKPYEPSIPIRLSVHSPASNKFIITWEPPRQPNGNITYYKVNATCSPMNQNDRDYCKEPPTQTAEEKSIMVPFEKSFTNPNNNETCSCDDGQSKMKTAKDTEKERVSQINFEDELHNKVYIKRQEIGDVPNKDRRKREVGNKEVKLFTDKHISTQLSTSSSEPLTEFTPQNSDSRSNCTAQYFIVTNTTFVMENLPHFTTYTIHVQACREEEDNETNNFCSTASIFTARTLKAEKVDDVTEVEVTLPSNQTGGMVHLMWKEPENPNGMILTYQIVYRRVDNINIRPTTECVTKREYSDKKKYILKDLPPGNYSVRVGATSLAGNGGLSPEKYFLIEDAKSGTTEVVIGIVLTILLLFCAVLTLFFIRRKLVPSVPNMKLIASVNPEYVSTVYVPDDWEIPRKKIELLRELGQGSFGMVYEGIARDVVKGKPEIRCAIKTVNEHATDRERIEFLNEASVMKAFDTTHVVRLLGVVSQGQPTLVVMELMANGDLKSYLRSHRPDTETYNPSADRQPPTLKRILQMAIEIADGMAYLAAKKFVHRDLAARNCMVAEDLTVKIGDFGMTRDIYETDYYRKGTKGLLPVRWMAPESLKDGVFTSNSDVWSYGVVLWEMTTLASQPYQGLSNDQVLRYVIDGGIMERPENCPDKLYNLMRVCWQHKPSLRPSFIKLETMLLEDACSNFKLVSFYHSTAGIEARTIHNAAQDDPSTPLRLTKEIEDFSLGSDSEQDSDPEDLVNDGANSDFDDKHVTINFPDFQVASFKGNQKSVDTSGPSMYSYKDNDRSQDTSGPSFGSYSESRPHENRSTFTVRDRKRSADSLRSADGRDSLLKESEGSGSAETNATANGYVGGRPTTNSNVAKTTQC